MARNFIPVKMAADVKAFGKIDLTHAQVHDVCESFIKFILSSVKDGNDVSITNFVKVSRTVVKERVFRNPKNSNETTKPEHYAMRIAIKPFVKKEFDDIAVDHEEDAKRVKVKGKGKAKAAVSDDEMTEVKVSGDADNSDEDEVKMHVNPAAVESEEEEVPKKKAEPKPKKAKVEKKPTVAVESDEENPAKKKPAPKGKGKKAVVEEEDLETEPYNFRPVSDSEDE